MTLLNWTDDQFLDMCLLSGCDYNPSLKGMGLKTAHKLVRRHGGCDEIFAALRREGRFRDELTDDYIDAYKHARMTFRFQVHRNHPQPQYNPRLPLADRFAGESTFSSNRYICCIRSLPARI